MNQNQRTIKIILAVLILSLGLLACGTGYQTTQKLVGNSGEVRLRMKESNETNSTKVEFNEDWSGVRVTSTVVFGVSSGSCRAVLSGENGSTITLDATAGNPGEASGDLVTDVFGEVSLETECQNAQELDLTISFIGN